MFKKGFRFVPSDEILVQFLYEKIHHGHDISHEFPLMEYDLYGPEEPSDVWEKFGGNRFNDSSNEDLYFFTKVQKVSLTGSRINRKLGSGGTWSAAYSREFTIRSSISHGNIGAPLITAKKTHLHYEKEGSPNHGAWNMHEFCLGYFDDGGHFCRYDDPYVICRLRKSRKGRNQKNLDMKSVGDRDHQPNVIITKKPRLLEHGCYEEGRLEYSRMGSTQPQIDEVLEARNMSNNSSEFTSSIHGSSTSFNEDVVGINIENDHVVVEEHSNPCTTTDEGVFSNSTETPMSFIDDVFQYDTWEKCTNLDADVYTLDTDGILKYLLEDDVVGINIENDHVVVEEHSNLCTTTDEGVLNNSTETPMSFNFDVFQFDNLCAWFDDRYYNVHSVQHHDDQSDVITKKPRLCERGYEEGVKYSRMGSRSTTVLSPHIDQDLDARNLWNNSLEFTTSIEGINVIIIQNDDDVVEAVTPLMSFDDNAFQYDNLCAWEKCTNLDEGVSSIDADGIMKYLLEDDDGDAGITVENDDVGVEEQSNSCTTVDQGVLTKSTNAETPMSFDFDNLGAWIDHIFPDEAGHALLKFFEEDHHVAVALAGGNELTPIIID